MFVKLLLKCAAYLTLAKRVCSLFFNDVRYFLHRIYVESAEYTIVACKNLCMVSVKAPLTLRNKLSL